MPKAINFLFFLLICTALPATVSAAGNRPVDVWNYYHFDGIAFTPGPAVDGSAFVAVRAKVRDLLSSKFRGQARWWQRIQAIPTRTAPDLHRRQRTCYSANR
jgi:hypothetical protein